VIQYQEGGTGGRWGGGRGNRPEKPKKTKEKKRLHNKTKTTRQKKHTAFRNPQKKEKLGGKQGGALPAGVGTKGKKGKSGTLCLSGKKKAAYRTGSMREKMDFGGVDFH